MFRLITVTFSPLSLSVAALALAGIAIAHTATTIGTIFLSFK
jgi:hypothetical protein